MAFVGWNSSGSGLYQRACALTYSSEHHVMARFDRAITNNGMASNDGTPGRGHDDCAESQRTGVLVLVPGFAIPVTHSGIVSTGAVPNSFVNWGPVAYCDRFLAHQPWHCIYEA